MKRFFAFISAITICSICYGQLTENALKVLDTPSEPLSGMDQFISGIGQYISNHYVPDHNVSINSSNKSYVRFVIDTTGSAQEITILKTFDTSTNFLVKKAILSGGKWTTPRHQGKAINQLFVLPIYFGAGKHKEETDINTNRDTTYFSKNSMPCEKEDSYYYTILPKEWKSFDGVVESYYTKNNVLKQSQHFRERTRHGKSRKYYESGELKSITNYNMGRAEGIYNEYYENRTLMETGSFKIDRDLSKYYIETFYDTVGNKTLERGNGRISKYIEKDKAWLTGNYVNGLKEGDFIARKKNGSIIYQDTYKAGNFVSGFSIDSSGIKSEYELVEQPATPKKGMKHFQKCLRKYLIKHYPKEARKNRVSGRVFIYFVIEKDGLPSSFKVLKGIGSGCDRVAIEAIESYGKWIPAKQRGRLVRQAFRIPINFKLSPYY